MSHGASLNWNGTPFDPSFAKLGHRGSPPAGAPVHALARTDSQLLSAAILKLFYRCTALYQLAARVTKHPRFFNS
eukprot:gene5397-5619_t